MLKNTKLVAGVIVLAVLVVIVAIWNSRRGGEGMTIDLLAQLGDTQKRSTWTQTTETLFGVKDVTIAGKTHKAIFAPPMSRIKFKIEVPRRGVLEVFYALREDAWTADGDGAQFRIGVSDGRTYEQYLQEAINPKTRDRDRKWLPATIDLSAYEGQMVEIVLSTDPGPPDNRDPRNDFCLWGDPKIKGR
ncbi:MAG: hypothetical protein NT151_07000 [Acidobacteria bacterium]|nr:hypothetical protein [Acidobacteriota bacterium]